VFCVALSVIASVVLRNVSTRRLAPHEDAVLDHGGVDAAREAQATDPGRPHQLHVILRGMTRGAGMAGGFIALVPLVSTSWSGIAPWKAALITVVAVGCWALPVYAARRPLIVAYAKSRGIEVKALKRPGRVRIGAVQAVLLFWPAVLATAWTHNLASRLIVAVVGYAVIDPVASALLLAVTIRIVAPDLAGPEVAQRVAQLATACGVKVAKPRIIRTRARKMANAYQVGWLPGLKYLAISDYLIDAFNGPELDAIIAHELGHARLRHALVRSLTGALLVAALWVIALTLTSGDDNPAVALGAIAVLILAGPPARSNRVRQEVAADDFAARVVGPASLASALNRLAEINAVDTLTSPEWDKQVGHPGIARRVARLEGQLEGNVGTAPPVTRHASGS
jgi:Zn-dependent protease with chaperone function